MRGKGRLCPRDRQAGQEGRIWFQKRRAHGTMGKERKESLAQRVAEVFDLPGDVLGGLPRIELTGDGELRMENHRGILDYGSEEIHVSGGRLAVRIRGEGLELRAMNRTELLITGRIRSVELE